MEREKHKISVYRAISPSGKMYIGISKNFEKRKRDHIKSAFNENDRYYDEAFKRAIRKYGDSLHWEILQEVESYREAHKLEKALIKEFNTYGENGYNMTKGGDGNSKKPYTRYKLKDILKDALRYDCKIDWYNNSRNMYLAAKRIDSNIKPGFMDKCCRHFKPKPRIAPNKVWSSEAVIREAKKYSSLSEMKSNCRNGSYAALNQLKINNVDAYRAATNHMRYPRSKWSFNGLLSVALKFKYKSDWERGCLSSYEYAVKRLKKRDPEAYAKITAHMEVKKHGR